MNLSIVTICRNADATIARTIESVLCQTYKDYEYIVIDGASTDKTVSVIEKYSSGISRFISEPDFGIWNAMNKGIRFSQGEYIYFLNAGDYLCDCNTLDEFFDRNRTGEDILYGDIIEDFGDIKVRKGFSDKITIRYLLSNMISHQCTFTKRSLFNTNGLLDETFRLVADYDFLWRCVMARASYRHTPHPIAVYDMGGITAKADNRDELIKEWSRAQAKNLPFVTFHFIYFLNPLLLRTDFAPFHAISRTISGMVGLDR
jgi:glycosyltransferase involved in cell wall biosynthesis